MKVEVDVLGSVPYKPTVSVDVKPVLNWANVCFAEDNSEYSTNFTSFLN